MPRTSPQGPETPPETPRSRIRGFFDQHGGTLLCWFWVSGAILAVVIMPGRRSRAPLLPSPMWLRWYVVASLGTLALSNVGTMFGELRRNLMGCLVVLAIPLIAGLIIWLAVRGH